MESVFKLFKGRGCDSNLIPKLYHYVYISMNHYYIAEVFWPRDSLLISAQVQFVIKNSSGAACPVYLCR